MTKQRMQAVACAVALAVVLTCAGADGAPTKGAPCHKLGRTVGHGGHVVTCRQGPHRDEWTWQ